MMRREKSTVYFQSFEGREKSTKKISIMKSSIRHEPGAFFELFHLRRGKSGGDGEQINTKGLTGYPTQSF
jgi:hypothetical protein